jgi:hypothetical protein
MDKTNGPLLMAACRRDDHPRGGSVYRATTHLAVMGDGVSWAIIWKTRKIANSRYRFCMSNYISKSLRNN